MPHRRQARDAKCLSRRADSRPRTLRDEGARNLFSIPTGQGVGFKALGERAARKKNGFQQVVSGTDGANPRQVRTALSAVFADAMTARTGGHDE